LLEDLRLLASYEGKPDGIGADERVLIARKGLRPESFASAPGYVKRFLDKCQDDYGKSTGLTGVELAHRAQVGEPGAWDILVEWKRPFLLSMIKRVCNGLPSSRVQVEELLQAAKAGLWEAVRKFDPSRGAKLETFAQWHVQRALRVEWKPEVWPHQIPVANEKSLVASGHDKSLDRIDAKLEVDSLLARADLTAREREVLMLHYGLRDGLDRTLSEISKREGVSVAYIFKLRRSALEKLRQVAV